MKRPHLKRIRQKAFTLIEIMVATVIMVILVGLVIQITSEVLKVWNRSSGKLSANAEARIAMDLLTQDLETAVFRNNGQQWLRVEAPVSTNNETAYSDNTVSLKLFSPALDRDTTSAGDICGIAYRLSFKESYANGENVYALYRYIASPKDTFDDLMGSSSQASSPQDSLTGSKGALGAVWDEANVTQNDYYLASNIVAFKVFIYEDDGTSNVTPVNANASGEITSNYAYGGSGGTTTPLLYADIVLTVVSDEGLELLKLPSLAGTGYSDASDIVREHGEIFSRRVNFMARPL